MGIDTINYKCPNCAAPMVFGISSQKWECHFCFSNFSEDDIAKIEANTGEKIQEASWTATSFEDQSTVAYVCPDCGGRVLTEPNTAATFCIYCHNPTVLASRLEGEYRPAMLLPFQHPKEDAIIAVQKLCKKKPFLPKKFREAVNAGEVEGLYVPYWLFSADVRSQLSAQAKNYTIWRDSTYEYTKTDVYQVEREATIPIKRVPVDGSSRMDDTLLEAIEPFRYNDLRPFSMEFLSGHFAETFDVDAATCYKRFTERSQQAVSLTMRGLVAGYDTVSVTSLNSKPFNEDTLYVMLPVWTVSVKYKQKLYTFAMNGQTGISAGKLPLSMGRIFAWLFGLFGVVFAVAMLIGGFLL